MNDLMWKVVDHNNLLRSAGTLEICLAIAISLRFLGIRCAVVSL